MLTSIKANALSKFNCEAVEIKMKNKETYCGVCDVMSNGVLRLWSLSPYKDKGGKTMLKEVYRKHKFRDVVGIKKIGGA